MTTPNDSRDFYPTPDNLAWEMAYSLQSTKYGWKHLPQPILEPSAGDGALARQIHAVADIRHDPKTGELDRYSTSKAKEFDLDCVELSSDFRAKLKKDGFRVVHDDFLTFRPAKKYAAIIMNPPFSAGAAHLLKALEIMKDGGKIRCLLNAETIRNPYTNERKELAQKLNELNAQIKYIPDAFKNARRAARVEVALISVDIPDKEPVSKIRLELNNEMTDHMKADPQLAALVSADPIAAAVERYNAAAEGIRRIYEEYNGIKSLFSAATADDKETEVLNFNKSYNEAIRSLRGLYWQKLFDLPQIRDNLTRAMQDEYHNRVSELVDYDFSPYNILTIREEMSANIVQGIESEIVELFNDWTNLHYNSEYSKNVHYYNGWCTNEAYKVGKKVIFRCQAFSDWSGRFEPSWNAESCLSRIISIHALREEDDGQRVAGSCGAAQFLSTPSARRATAAGPAAGRWVKEKGQGRRRGVRCCSGLWSALAAMVPAGCVPVPVVGLICWRCRWAWSALAPFPLSAFQRHGWRWRCSIRAGFGRLPEGSDSPPNGSEKQV